MELLDVVNDIETPPTSEDEDPESPILHPPRTEHILQLLLNMLAAISTLTRETSYSELYYDQKYLKNVEKKMKKMKKNAKRVNFEEIYRHECFQEHLTRIEHMYPDDGGRAFLNHLVALEAHLTTEYDTDTDSDYDYDNSEREELEKKNKKKDDEDHQGDGGQMITV